MALDAAKSVNESGLVLNVCSRAPHGRDRAWKSMEELPVRSLLSLEPRQRRVHSELLHASLASSSPTCASVIVLSSSLSSTPQTGHATHMQDIESQVMCTHELAALGGMQCETHAFWMKDIQKQEASSCTSNPLERGDAAEHPCPVERTKPQQTSALNCTLPKSKDTELFNPGKDEESRDGSACTFTVLERAKEAEDMPLPEGGHLQETPTFLSGIHDTEQAAVFKVELRKMSTPVSVSLEGEDYAQNMQESSSHVSFQTRTEENTEQATQQMEGKLSQDMSTQVSATFKGTECTADDMEPVSEIRNMGSQETSMSMSWSSQWTSDPCMLQSKNEGLQEISTHTSVIELSLREHLQQGDAVEEEAAMRSFIMHRFLPAAKEVAAEHESSIASLVSHSQAPPSPLPRQFQRVPRAHHVKSRAQHAPRGFISSLSLRSWHQEDGMPLSMRSCGFFCLGLKSALFRVHRTVSASARSTLRKKSWAPHQTKVADEDPSLIRSEVEGPIAQTEEAVLGVAKHKNAENIHFPISHRVRSSNSGNVPEGLRRRALKKDFSRSSCPNSDGCADCACNPPFSCPNADSCTDGACNPSSSQSSETNLLGNQLETMKLTQSSVDNPVAVRDVSNVALKEQDDEVPQECVASCSRKRMNDCNVNPNTPSPQGLEGKPVSSSPLQDYMGGSEVNIGKPAHDYDLRRGSRQDGNDEEDDELQFFDALSRLNSVKSNATFYTFGSPRSEHEAVGFEGDGVGFTDASSHFETPRSSMSKNKPVLSNTCVATEEGMSGKISSLSQRIGKGLKLETESKQAKSPSKHDPCVYQQELEPLQAEIQSESISRSTCSLLVSMSGLCASKTSPIPPVFPAKCQNNTPNGMGWPFGISTYQASRDGVPQHHIRQERSIEKYAVRGNVPSPPLPPSPTESWLAKAVTKNASKTSPLAILQHKEKVVSARRKLDFIVVDPDAERRWENVVKESQVQLGHLRFSEELHHHHPSNLNTIKPSKL